MHDTIDDTHTSPEELEEAAFGSRVVTTAMFLCEFDPQQVDPGTGEILPAEARMAVWDTLVFEYALPRHLQFSPCDVKGSYKGGIIDLFTRLHIMVVQALR